MPAAVKLAKRLDRNPNPTRSNAERRKKSSAKDCKEQELAPQVKDTFTAKWLWAVSEKWTRLKYYKEHVFDEEQPQHDHHKDEGNVVLS